GTRQDITYLHTLSSVLLSLHSLTRHQSPSIRLPQHLVAPKKNPCIIVIIILLISCRQSFCFSTHPPVSWGFSNSPRFVFSAAALRPGEVDKDCPHLVEPFTPFSPFITSRQEKKQKFVRIVP